MTTRWKERIIGIVVIVGLLVIWLPFFLNSGSKPSEKKELMQQMKEQNSDKVIAEHQEQPVPTIAPTKIEAQAPIVDNEIQEVAADISEPVIANESLEKIQPQKKEALPAEQHFIKKPAVAEQIVAVEPKEKEEKAEEVAKVDKPQEKAPSSTQWAVRVAQISTADNAKFLMNKLKQKGFAPYQQQSRLPSGNRVFTIWIGKSVNRAEANKSAARLKKLAGLSGTVTQTDRG